MAAVPLTAAQAEQAYIEVPTFTNYQAWQTAKSLAQSELLRQDLTELRNNAVEFGLSALNDFQVLGDYWHADNGYYVPMPAKPSAAQSAARVTLYSFTGTKAK